MKAISLGVLIIVYTTVFIYLARVDRHGGKGKAISDEANFF